MTVAMSDAGGVKYLLTDHLGSVAAVTDDQGALLDQQRYLPFGAVRENVGIITQTDFGYTGQRDLAGMGLMDYKARAYDPLLGRFIQPDRIIPNPADPQGWNRFSYVRNNPIIWTDPTGNKEEEGCEAGHLCELKNNPTSEDNRCGRARDDCAPPTTIGSDTSLPPASPLIPPTTTLRDISWYARYMNNMLDFVQGLGISTTMVKKTFLWGKAVNPIPPFDFALGAAGQAINDTTNPNLTLGQRAGRAFTVGGESMITGVASDIAGGLGFLAGEAVVPEGGGIVGYPVAALASSVYIDEVVWTGVNRDNFPGWNLGAYP